MIAVALAAAAAMTTTPPAHADRVYAVAVGDALLTSTERCTLGALWRRSGQTRGLTAGHCAQAVGQQVRDVTTGTVGVFIAVPQSSTDYDYAVIDFGSVTPSPMIPAAGATISELGRAVPGTVCHAGVASGVECGTVGSPVRPDPFDGQILASGMHGRPGDSGGPVFQLDADGRARIVGIWHGSFDDGGGDPSGAFVDISTIMTAV